MAFDPFFQFMRGIQGKLNNGGLGNANGGQNSQQIAFIRSLQKELKQGDVLNVPLEKLKVVVFDIETTGFFPHQGDEIISIGAIKVCGEKIQEDQQFYSLIQSEKEVSREIQNLTGITNDQLKGSPPISEVLIEFFGFVQNETLVAHHANHEKSFLQSANRKNFRAPFNQRIVDTSFLYRIAEPDLKIVRLEDFCDHNQIPIVNRHHALGDARLTAKLWSIYIQKVNELGCETLHDVYERIARMK
jgi:DNA polymerase III subunit epsilon